jgi:ribosomal protein S6--L-glutamate ligase
VRIALLTHRASPTNLGLAAAAPPGVSCFLLAPVDADAVDHTDAVLGRLDVRDTLDGIEPGCSQLEDLEHRGLTVLNRSLSLRLAHDKLATAGVLAASAVPHPRTVGLLRADEHPPLPFPFVLKPRYGSWGRDVLLCVDELTYGRALATYRVRPWFAACGAVAQQLVPPRGHDLRVVVAGGSVIGAIKRVAKRGEWRTNVALGAARVPVEPSPAACDLALAAAAAISGDLVGVDILPVSPGRYVVLEVNGAVDFSAEYAPGGDVYASAMDALVRTAARKPRLLPELAEAAAW